MKHKAKQYLIYGWHILLLLAILAIAWRIQNPPWDGISIAPWPQERIYDGISIRHPSGGLDEASSVRWYHECRSSRGDLAIEMSRATVQDPLWHLKINGQSYGRVTEGDRLEIDYGPKVKVNGEERQPRAAENQAATETFEK